jgi:hypothetical protein
MILLITPTFIHSPQGGGKFLALTCAITNTKSDAHRLIFLLTKDFRHTMNWSNHLTASSSEGSSFGSTSP